MGIRDIAALALALAASAFAADKDARVTAKYRVTGLFCKERVADLREAMKAVEKVVLVSVDYDTAEAVFRYAPKEAFPGASKPEQILQQLDNKVRHATSHTFGVTAPLTTPRGRLTWVEIPAAGCDCKACSLAAYEAVYKLEGVEQARASFREGRVSVLIDPTKTDRGKLAAALKKRGVAVKIP